MIPELRHQTFISLVKGAKQLSQQTSISSKSSSDPSLNHLSVRNQRRIKRYRSGQKTKSFIGALLHKEIIEHQNTRTHLQASVEKLKQDNEKIDIKDLKKRLSQVKRKITIVKKNKRYSKKKIAVLEQKAKHLSLIIKKL